MAARSARPRSASRAPPSPQRDRGGRLLLPQRATAWSGSKARWWHQPFVGELHAGLDLDGERTEARVAGRRGRGRGRRWMRAPAPYRSPTSRLTSTVTPPARQPHPISIHGHEPSTAAQRPAGCRRLRPKHRDRPLGTAGGERRSGVGWWWRRAARWQAPGRRCATRHGPARHPSAERRNRSPTRVPRPPSVKLRCGGSPSVPAPRYTRVSRVPCPSPVSQRPSAVARRYSVGPSPPSSASRPWRSCRTAIPPLARSSPSRATR
jgi:hypothetical protein